jgi:hypothetical protein
VPSGERKQQVKILLLQLKNHAKDIPEVEKLTFSVKRPGPPQGEDVEIQVIGNNDEQRRGEHRTLSIKMIKIWFSVNVLNR